MSAINLHAKYDKEIQTQYVKDSLLGNCLDNTYSFSGVKTVRISTPITVPMSDYSRTGMMMDLERKCHAHATELSTCCFLPAIVPVAA